MDKSLLDRLAALRGSSPTTKKEAPVKIDVDVIERKSATPSREDALASRLKALRDQTSPSPSPSSSSQPQARDISTPSKPAGHRPEAPEKKDSFQADDDVEAAFATDDRTLEELLGDVGPDDEPVEPPLEPDDAKVKALLEELSHSIPQDESSESKKTHAAQGDSDDDSDGEKMTNEVDDVIARFRDEIEVEAAQGSKDDDNQMDTGQEQQDSSDEGDNRQTSGAAADLELPSVPQDLAAPDQVPSSAPSSNTLDDITARLSALRASSASPSFDLPSVPTSKPAKEPNRLKSSTKYTDDDMSSWCTVCLEDATLKCLGCDDDPYCVRCWREMHLGPTAAFDDRDHKAVYFTREGKKEKRVALGA
ncbi:unnamed protein product [Clonostachys rosea f. rosea IK726]|uniref:Uncharacterized protein n=2 Tax=Bionectria ochroleuca TaxID=29856 RepID=A0A0B7JIM6_BIOOC|nr:unnamed protein product [Clonostachys rosea f. rosea IK726]